MRHVFVDESCQNDHHYMVLGALIVPGAYVAMAERELEAVLEKYGMMRSEFKWTKVSRGKCDAYKAVVDLYFDVLCHHGVEFHAVAIDSHGLDHRWYNEGDVDLGFNKFLYQLLLHRVGMRFGFDERIVVDLDSRNTSRDPVELQRILNSKMGAVLGDHLRPPFARIAHRDSKSARLLQLTDLLAGAIAWHRNDQDARHNASPAKIELADLVAEKTGQRRIGANSPRSERRLSVWNLALKKRGGAR